MISPSRSLLSCLALSLQLFQVSANAGLFTYYETPLFSRIGNQGTIMAKEPAVGNGPSQWRNIIFPPQIAPLGNQCGGVGQQTGFGQSPIVVPAEARDQCSVGMTGYKFEAGTCTWNDLNFQILNNGAWVGIQEGAACTLGRMKIPNKKNWFNALQFHIHTSSEHSVAGTYAPAELHVVHQESTGESFAVFGMFVDQVQEMMVDASTGNVLPVDEDHEVFESFLKGWEAKAKQTEEYCAVYPQGTEEWVGNSILESRQMRLQCPKVAEGIDPDSVEFEGQMPINRFAESMDDDLDTTIPNIYMTLPDSQFGLYTYRGGLTTPPCTEIVHWNLLDKPLRASKQQIDRLYERILCFVEISTCKHATIANEAGFTNRPVQALNGRTVTHRCQSGPNSTEPIPDPMPPQYEFVNTQPQRCVLGGSGGPLRLCWVAHLHNHFAMIFPWFVMAMGLVTFYLLSRYCHWFPYTASMFLLGIFMGVAIVRLDHIDQISSSIRMWENIDAETLLLAFLPGLLFRDSYCSNVFLFAKALPQALLLAFPGVLVGTCLTALVGYYILPYGWSWSFCMMFGSILSATDPVAVAALLGEVGAPPRLQTHIGGESMLNDGSAIVFFTIFSQIFLSELNIPGVGTEITFGTGFALFFRMSLGAVAVGAAFALVLLSLVYLLNRRFNYEESIVQVTATITTAYLSYYVAEAVLGMSGVISVVTCGIMTKFCASSIFNDPDMMSKFWVTVEHILNSLLFTLGGVVWGTVISQEDPDRPGFKFSGEDWGYLFLVYFFVMVIRFFLVFGFYPLFSRCGLKSNWREALFMVWGGLRGAVGIALAIALDKELQHDLFFLDPRRRYSSQLFGLTGGIAFLTLVVNGTLAGPILRKLGLTDVGESRKKVVERYREVITSRMLCDLLQHLGHTRFSGVDYSIVRSHISFLQDVTPAQLRYAVKHNKEFSPLLDYKQPNLATMKPFMTEEDFKEIVATSKVNTGARLRAVISMASIASMSSRASLDRMDESSKRTSNVRGNSIHSLHKFMENDKVDDEDAVELRKVFIELLRFAYEEQFNSGEIDVRDGLLVYALKSSVEVSSDLVNQGFSLDDWYALTSAAVVVDTNRFSCSKATQHKQEWSALRVKRFTETRALVKRAIAFIEAHHRAQKAFKNDYCNGQMLSETEVLIIEESDAQVKEAERALSTCQKEDVSHCVGHVLCSILLSKAADLVGNLTQTGLLREQEAEEYLHAIEHDLHHVEHCHGDNCEEYGTIDFTQPQDDSESDEIAKPVLVVSGDLSSHSAGKKACSFRGFAFADKSIEEEPEADVGMCLSDSESEQADSSTPFISKTSTSKDSSDDHSV